MEDFTLHTERWYAFEFAIAPFGYSKPRFLPVFVEKLGPRKSGKGLLGLQGYSPTGDLQMELHVWQRTTDHLAAGASKENCVTIRAVTFDWLGALYPEIQQREPFPPEPRYESDVQYYLDRVFDRQMSHWQFTNYEEQQLVFYCYYFQRAEARHLSLVIEAENLLDLKRKTMERVAFYFSQRAELKENIFFEVDYNEDDVLTVCALRFDGYKYLDQVLNKDATILQAYIEEGGFPSEDTELQMAMFFHLQRYLMKWGGEYEPKNGKSWRLFRSLFLAVANEPVPPRFQLHEYYERWLINYEPFREKCVRMISRIHESCEYDDNAHWTGLPHSD